MLARLADDDPHSGQWRRDAARGECARSQVLSLAGPSESVQRRSRWWQILPQQLHESTVASVRPPLH
jgi:hypothetical protein